MGRTKTNTRAITAPGEGKKRQCLGQAHSLPSPSLPPPSLILTMQLQEVPLVSPAATVLFTLCDITSTLGGNISRVFKHLRARDSSYSCQDVPGPIKTFVLVVVPCVLFTTETGKVRKERGRVKKREEGGERSKNMVRKRRGKKEMRKETGRKREEGKMKKGVGGGGGMWEKVVMSTDSLYSIAPLSPPLSQFLFLFPTMHLPAVYLAIADLC